MATEFGSVEEISGQLVEYEEQKEQVELLLKEDQDNEELLETLNTLEEAILLIQDLLKDVPTTTDPQAPSDQRTDVGASTTTSTGPVPIQGVPRSYPSLLPVSVAEQIRRAQIRAALSGTAPAAWAVGARCQALYSGDGQWYDAVVLEALQEKFQVQFDGYGNVEEVEAASVRPPPDTQEVYKGVEAPKRKRVEDVSEISEIPKWCEIQEKDDDKTKNRKKKLLKSYKSKIRFQQMDLKQKKKQQAWQSFVKGKGKKKKAGFFTGRKKDSIFKVPDGVDSKVGVIGSGKGMTDYKQRSKHEFTLDDV